MTGQPLLDAIPDSWDRNNTILVNLLRALPEATRKSGRSRGTSGWTRRERKTQEIKRSGEHRTEAQELLISWSPVEELPRKKKQEVKRSGEHPDGSPRTPDRRQHLVERGAVAALPPVEERAVILRHPPDYRAKTGRTDSWH